MSQFQEYPAWHDPDSELDYGRNWGTDLEGNLGFLTENEKIITSDWFITSDIENPPTLEIAIQGSGISEDGQITSVYLKGGTSGVVYKLTNRIKTFNTALSINRQMEMTGILSCYQR